MSRESPRRKAASQRPEKAAIVEPVVEVGGRYMITWRNGNVVEGDIVETRLCKKQNAVISSSSINESNNANSSSSNSSRGSRIASTNNEERNELEYYVHYLGYDRRLDEWVTLDRIDTTVGSAIQTTSVDAKSPGLRQQKRRRTAEGGDGDRDHKEAGHTAASEHEEEITKVKNINSIVLGKYEIETWYYSPYPAEYCNEDRLYICEYCLKYMKCQKTLRNQMKECGSCRPPGKQIYREADLAMYEIDGQDKKIYCQNLCLLSKLFLDHKTLYYDVDPFMYYVLCEVDSEGSHIVGYFSKEKQSEENYNLSCILTFPSYQRKGYGKFLISISYELSKKEGTTGSPEKPLSDLGKISYLSYWTFVLMKYFREYSSSSSMTLNEITRMTGIQIDDVLSTLESLNFIHQWKGRHVIQISSKEVENFNKQAKFVRLCDPACLDWSPSEKMSKKDKI